MGDNYRYAEMTLIFPIPSIPISFIPITMAAIPSPIITV